MNTLKQIFSYLKPHKKTIFEGIACLIIVDLLQMIVPQIERHVIDSLRLPGFTSQGLVKFSLLIVALVLVMAVLRYLWRLLLIGTSFKIERKIRNDFYEHLQRLSAHFFQNHKTGNLMAYATNDLRSVRMLFGMGVVISADAIVMSIASLALMSSIDWHLTIYVIIPLPLITFIMIFFGKRIHRLFAKVQKTFAELSDKVQESISGIRVIKSFVREDAYEHRVGDVANELVEQNMRLIKIWGMFFPAISAIIGISLLLTFYLGGTKTILNQITIGEFVAFNSYLYMLIWPAIAVGWVVNIYQRGTASFDRIQKIMQEKPEIVDSSCVDKSIRKLKGDIEVRNLKFAYPESKHIVLDNISFQLNSGESLAIVGRTGEGKSTVIKLLTRTFNPPENSIFIDGKDIFRIPLSTLRKNIAVVAQDIFLFSSSVAENIRFGRQTVSQNEIIKTAHLSQFYNDIMQFEQQFDSIIGERGVSLSGGQKQRLAIARALVKEAPILVLDDAFSSVDTETENEILKNLKLFQRNKTTLIIAHRISTMQHADKIIVLDNGKIVEQGNHESLIKQGGIYKGIYDKQKLKEELER